MDAVAEPSARLAAEFAVPGADTWLCRQFLPPALADACLARLGAELAWREEALQLFGRRQPVPRLVAFYGDAGLSYRYSGLDHPALVWHPLLAALRRLLRRHLGSDFNCVLANLYRDGDDCMGWHSDDEAALGREPRIASLSFGASRDFLLRQRGDVRRRHCLLLEHGSLLLMEGCSQHGWQHCLPRRRRVRTARINLTFRTLNPVAVDEHP